MNTYTDKKDENKSQAAANSLTTQKSNGKSTFQLVDNRPELINQRKHQEMANGSSQVKQLKKYQNFVNQPSGVVQRQINDDAYNSARKDLINAGSNSARSSHPKHTRSGSSPDGHGISLIQEAIEEFRHTDANLNALTRGMSGAHFVAVSNAAHDMGLDIEDIFRRMGE